MEKAATGGCPRPSFHLLRVAVLLALAGVGPAEKRCGHPPPMQVRERMAGVVLSGTVKRVYPPDRFRHGEYRCEVEVKQIFKGRSRVKSSANHVSPSRRQPVVMVAGFGNSACDKVRPRDTRIFLLARGSYGELRLNSSILPITLNNLRHMWALTHNESFVPVSPPKKLPCETHFCAFNAMCIVNTTTNKAACKCLEKCSGVFSPVCGSNNVTYTNLCYMKKASCQLQIRIKEKFMLPCSRYTRDPCEGKRCSYGAQCVPSLDGMNYRCQCPQKCSTYGDNIGSTPVCGNDGADYPNMCEMRRAACQQMTDIRVKYYGMCDPCEGHRCPASQVCQLDKKRKPVCRCNIHCMSDLNPVCGTNGRTYSNLCFLQMEACKTRQNLKVHYQGTCDQGINPCNKLNCGLWEHCRINRQGKAECVCPPVCEPVLRPVCGTDGTTYDNECHLQRQSCRHKTSVNISHRGPCGINRPCVNHSCFHDSVCVIRDGKPSCDCVMCSVEFKPVCGTNGISYINKCKLKQENCEKKTQVSVKHKGLCDGCEEKNCEFYAHCENDGRQAVCVCPSACVEVENKVCGTDGFTYQNECELRVSSCRKEQWILVESHGHCNKCSSVRCPFGARCEDGKCVCPNSCSKNINYLCASNSRTYTNECHMKRDACRQNIELDIEYSGPCDPSGSGSGDPSGVGPLECDESSCHFGGSCELTEDGSYKCVCKNSCDAIRSPVCGSDNKKYGNECMMKLEACNQQKEIIARPSEDCEDGYIETACDGSPALVDPETGAEYNCLLASSKCPAGSYCHRGTTFGKCCQEVFNVITSCKDTQFGCCPDKKTTAPGPNDAGCPSNCQCNALGSYRSTCDLQTQQCSCKPGVGGLRCDRCEPGFWGLLQIAQGKSGCTHCNCNIDGSMRDDCEQMTGRCMCRPDITGMKCNICPDGRHIGPNGCKPGPVPQSCRDVRCNFGAICSERRGYVECICEDNCKEDSLLMVCGTDGQPYGSACQLRKVSCRLQKPISIAHEGPCEGTTVGRVTTPLSPTMRSRKTTRHIHPPNGNEVTKIIFTKSTDKPSEIIGRIDDLCPEENSCDIPNSECVLGICACKKGFIPTLNLKNCLEVVTIAGPPRIPKEICALNPCHNGGSCLPDDTLGYRCVCPLGFGGSLCRDRVIFNTPSFSGTSYLKVPQIRNATDEMIIEIEIRSLNNDGLILYNSQEETGDGDFVSLALNNGHVELRYDLGSGSVTLKSRKPIELNKYHRIVAKRTGQEGFLVVDNDEEVIKTSPGSLSSLNLEAPLYVGFTPNLTNLIISRTGVEVGFVGCIRKLFAGSKAPYEYKLQYPYSPSDVTDGVDVGECGKNPCSSLPCQNGGTCLMLDVEIFQCICQVGYTGTFCETADPCINNPCQANGVCISHGDGKYTCDCPEGRKGRYCEKETLQSVHVPQFDGAAYLERELTQNMHNQISIEMWFKATDPDGVLLFSTQFPGGEGDFIALNLHKKQVEFSIDLGSGPNKIRSSEEIILDEWYTVVVKRRRRKIELILNGTKSNTMKTKGKLTDLNLSDHLYIGGFKDIFDVPANSGIDKPFKGAVQRLYINSHLIADLIYGSRDSKGITEYTGMPCRINPCLNGGVCVPQLNKADCRCPKRYTGNMCQELSLKSKQMHFVKFSGDTFFSYPNNVQDKQTGQQSNYFEIKFHTKKRHGLLLFQNKGGDVKSDYFAIAIVNGKVHLSYNLGKQSEKDLHVIESPMKVNDGKWHVIQAERDKRHGLLKVDGMNPVGEKSTDGASQLDTDGILWIGGRRKEDIPQGLPKEYYKGFEGCIDYVKVNQNHVLDLVTHRISYNNAVKFCS